MDDLKERLAAAIVDVVYQKTEVDLVEVILAEITAAGYAVVPVDPNFDWEAAREAALSEDEDPLTPSK